MKKNSSVIPFPGTYKPPRAPAGTGPAGRRLWRAIQLEYVIKDAGGLAHLTQAVRAEDDLSRMRRLVLEDGDVLLDRFQQKKQHPLIAAIAAMEAVRRAALHMLNLDVEPLKDGPGRPRGK